MLLRRLSPQSIDTTSVALQLVHDIHFPNPVSVPIYAADTGIPLVTKADFSPQEAIVDGVLHYVCIFDERWEWEARVVSCFHGRAYNAEANTQSGS
jgi:hypothetical protein